MKTHLTLAELAAAQPMRDVACNRCPRRGRVNVARLLAELGPDFPGPELWPIIAADCPKMVAGNKYHDRCGVHFPQS